MAASLASCATRSASLLRRALALQGIDQLLVALDRVLRLLEGRGGLSQLGAGLVVRLLEQVVLPAHLGSLLQGGLALRLQSDALLGESARSP